MNDTSPKIRDTIRLSDLIDLRQKIEKETAEPQDFVNAFGARPDNWHAHASRAYMNDVTAAFKLLEIMLPGWGWQVFDTDGARVWDRARPNESCFKHPKDNSPCHMPGRALLISIIDALLAQGGQDVPAGGDAKISRLQLEQMIELLGQTTISGPPTTGLKIPINPMGKKAIEFIRKLYARIEELNAQLEAAQNKADDEPQQPEGV